MKILIMGLPGSGKTTLAKSLNKELNFIHLNADEVRAKFNDWDFSYEGRKRQAERMRDLASSGNFILDFVCPKKEFISIVEPDFIIWMDTIKVSRFEDTNKAFNEPELYDMCIENFDYDTAAILWKLNSDLLLKLSLGALLEQSEHS